ncbi:flagellar export protein FliJ [Desulfitibacter alkalitolerans]|uniref:flagellar export protein FliJ n=1 Tax=Desulfitibacter alkalitolerans TaxID=264641 RepID=UPI000483A84A|nr:flagellar export protein FliJ [Desulfitibacter alkalitolerans]
MGFQFPLQRLLTYKESIEEKKKERLADLQDRRRVLEEELSETQSQYKICSSKNPKAKVNILQFGHQLAYMEYLDHVIDEQTVAVEKASCNVDRCRKEVVEAMRDRKVIEKLKFKQEATYYNELERKELIELNEIALNKYLKENNHK